MNEFNMKATKYPRNKHCSVKFSEDINIILEPDNLAEDLHLARKSDYAQRQADKARMERLLTPILNTKHRRDIYEKIYGKCDS